MGAGITQVADERRQSRRGGEGAEEGERLTRVDGGASEGGMVEGAIGCFDSRATCQSKGEERLDRWKGISADEQAKTIRKEGTHLVVLTQPPLQSDLTPLAGARAGSSSSKEVDAVSDEVEEVSAVVCHRFSSSACARSCSAYFPAVPSHPPSSPTAPRAVAVELFPSPLLISHKLPCDDESLRAYERSTEGSYEGLVGC